MTKFEYMNLIFRLVLRLARKITGVKKYRIGNRELRLPAEHPLPEYQRLFPSYDRFLPVLAGRLPVSGWIIDVGANVGDTAIAMVQETGNEILCIEPYHRFHRLLRKNRSMLPPSESERIHIATELVGTGDFPGKLESGNGTAKIVESSSNTNSSPVSLDNLLSGYSRVCLIKTDTDGFDFDVLLSGTSTIAALQPLLFWENQVGDASGVEKFEQLYRFLESCNYLNFWVFDNFGNLVGEDVGIRDVYAFNRQLPGKYMSASKDDFHYVDILAACEKDAFLCRQAIRDFKLRNTTS